MNTQRKKLGLALAGGVFRGRAHVGVLQALEEAGIEADVVSGVSAGAIVAACYAAGLKGKELEEMAREFGWLRIVRLSLLNPFRSGLARLGLIDFSNLELMLIRILGDITFEELRRPLAIGATDLMTGKRVTITSGRVAPAVRASCSVPGIVIPACRRGRVLCDGVISSNLPIQELRNQGAEVVLAVNIMPLPRRLPSNFFWAGSSAFSELVLAAGDRLELADLLIEPDLAETSYLFPDMAELIARSRAATEPVIPALKALLEKDQEFTAI